MITTFLGAGLGFSDFELTKFLPPDQAVAFTTLITAIVGGLTLWLMTQAGLDTPAKTP